MKIIFATGNEGKMKEVRMILEDLGAEILSMKEAGIDVTVKEDGGSFEENAAIKAAAVAAHTDAVVLADDSGLEIDFLNGAPGIYSARYLGEKTSYRIKNASLLERMKDVPPEQRTARFVCAIAAVLPGRDGRPARTVYARGVMEGRIGYEERGGNGFGYDPIFFLPEEGKYSAELSPERKNELSHRGKALRAIREKLVEWDEQAQAGRTP